MHRLSAFSPKLSEWVAMVCGAMAIGLAMHWTVNLWTLMYGLEGQGQNSLQAIRIKMAYAAGVGYHEVTLNDQLWVVTVANQEALCLHNALFHGMGDWLAATPIMIPLTEGGFGPALVRSWFGVDEIAQAAMLITSGGYALSVLLVMAVNLRKPILITSFTRYFLGAALLIVFIRMILGFGFYSIVAFERSGVTLFLSQEDSYWIAIQAQIFHFTAIGTIFSLLAWILPLLFLAVNKLRVVVVCFGMWVLSTPLFLLLVKIDQMAC